MERQFYLQSYTLQIASLRPTYHARRFTRTERLGYSVSSQGGEVKITGHVHMVIFFVLMIACIVGADVAFLRDRFVLRLIVNMSIVAVFAATYFAFLRNR